MDATLLIASFVTFFVIVNPIGLTPIFHRCSYTSSGDVTRCCSDLIHNGQNS